MLLILRTCLHFTKLISESPATFFFQLVLFPDIQKESHGLQEKLNKQLGELCSQFL